MAAKALQLVSFVWRHPNNRGRRLRALLRLGLWQIHQRVAGTPLRVEVAGTGLVILCHPHDTAASGVLYAGLPEWPEMLLPGAWMRPGDVMVDVGANVGVWSLLAAAVDGVRVVALEPAYEAFLRACENVSLNHLEHRVRVARLAAGPESGTASITAGLGTRNRVLAAGGPADPAQQVETVEVVSLDDLLADEQSRVALVKVDVEGAEAGVLSGATGLLRRHRPLLIVEANDPPNLRRVLEPLGYRPFVFDPDALRLEPASWSADPTRRSRNMIVFDDAVEANRRLGLPASQPRTSR